MNENSSNKKQSIFRRYIFSYSYIYVLALLGGWIFLFIQQIDNPRIVIFNFDQNYKRFGVLDSMFVSFIRVWSGSVIALCIGITTAVCLYVLSSTAANIVRQLSFLVAITPGPIWITVNLMLFGVSDIAAVVTVFLSTVFLIIGITITQIGEIPTRYWYLCKLFDVSAKEKIAKIIFPTIAPSIILTIRLTFLVGWISILIAESAGAPNGLGAMLIFGRQLLDWGTVLVSWVTILLAAAATDTLINHLLSAVVMEHVGYEKKK